MTYITPHKVFSHVDRLAAWRAGERPGPVTIEWDLTNVCSLGCQSCHFAHTHVKGPWAGRRRVWPVSYDHTGEFANVDLVAGALAEAAQAGVQGVVWSGGGEPTLHTRWQEIIAQARSCGLQQGMYTLGGHLTPQSGMYLGRIATWVVVSLDALTAETYAKEKGVSAERFKAACDGIGFLAGHGATVGVSFLLHELNWTNAYGMLALARKLGADYVMFRPTIETSPEKPGTITGNTSWITEALPTLRALAAEENVECGVDRFIQYRDWQGHGYSACHGIKMSTTITPDGRVWVCPQRRGVKGSCLGDLRDETFGSIWARHPGAWTDFSACRAMCRLHLTNQALAPVFEARPHEAFI